MGEEKKESKNIKKMKYEEPRLFKLNTDTGEGQCETGSGARGCSVGNTPFLDCYNGNSPGAVCTDGNAPHF